MIVHKIDGFRINNVRQKEKIKEQRLALIAKSWPGFINSFLHKSQFQTKINKIAKMPHSFPSHAWHQYLSLH
jgi:hypothetical protein